MINPLPVSLPKPDFRDANFKDAIGKAVNPHKGYSVFGCRPRMQSLADAWNIALPTSVPRFPDFLVMDTPDAAEEKIRKFLAKYPGSVVWFDITTNRKTSEPYYHRFIARRSDDGDVKAKYHCSSSVLGPLDNKKIGEEYWLLQVLADAEFVEIQGYDHKRLVR